MDSSEDEEGENDMTAFEAEDEWESAGEEEDFLWKENSSGRCII